MWDLPNCNSLPPLGQLPKLERLTIRRIDSIKKIDVDLYGGTRAFPRLQEFRIDGMKCLEEWITVNSNDKFGLNEPALPCLRYIELRHCPRLKLKPHPPRSMLSWSLLRHLPFVERLSNSCSSQDFLQGLTSLRTLTVEDCESIMSLPERLEVLTSLTKLHILNCKGIKTLPDSVRRLLSLESLVIIGCPELVQWCQSKKNSKKLAHIKERVYEAIL
ncbi:unnamed protein product [Urochloa humidicola]